MIINVRSALFSAKLMAPQSGLLLTTKQIFAGISPEIIFSVFSEDNIECNKYDAEYSDHWMKILKHYSERREAAEGPERVWPALGNWDDRRKKKFWGHDYDYDYDYDKK